MECFPAKTYKHTIGLSNGKTSGTLEILYSVANHITVFIFEKDIHDFSLHINV